LKTCHKRYYWKSSSASSTSMAPSTIGRLCTIHVSSNPSVQRRQSSCTRTDLHILSPVFSSGRSFRSHFWRLWSALYLDLEPSKFKHYKAEMTTSNMAIFVSSIKALRLQDSDREAEWIRLVRSESPVTLFPPYYSTTHQTSRPCQPRSQKTYSYLRTQQPRNPCVIGKYRLQWR
jgi:hypothetical protein